MKALITTFILLFVITYSAHAQTPVTQVEGFLEVYHPIDSTSLYIGLEAGQQTSSNFNRNTFVGFRVGRLNTSGSDNSFFGNASAPINTMGSNNSFFGSGSGFNNTTGESNSFFGRSSGRSNTMGSDNSFYGHASGDSNTTGFWNSFFGRSSGDSNTTGSDNSFFGRSSGESNTTGETNSFFGVKSGFINTTGSDNSFFGISSGDSITTQSRVVAIGANAGPTADSARSDRLYIDVTLTDDPLIYGEFDNDLLRINGTLQLGGQNYFGGSDDGVIRSPRGTGSDLFLVANDAVTIEIGDVEAEVGTFEIWNGAAPNLTSTALTNFVFKVDESGNVSAKGNITTTGTITGIINNVSDINRKESFQPINTTDILDKITNLPITEWQYKSSPDRHIGPMAQDFYAAFGLGQGETTIATVDADGVALAAIQALAMANEELKKKNDELEKRLARLESIVLDKN